MDGDPGVVTTALLAAVIKLAFSASSAANLPLSTLKSCMERLNSSLSLTTSASLLLRASFVLANSELSKESEAPAEGVGTAFLAATNSCCKRAKSLPRTFNCWTLDSLTLSSSRTCPSSSLRLSIEALSGAVEAAAFAAANSSFSLLRSSRRTLDASFDARRSSSLLKSEALAASAASSLDCVDASVFFNSSISADEEGVPGTDCSSTRRLFA